MTENLFKAMLVMAVDVGLMRRSVAAGDRIDVPGSVLDYTVLIKLR